MGPLTVLALLVVLLAVGSHVVARLLDHLAPGFARRPLLGLLTWTGAATGWVLGFLAVGPVLAWSFSGVLLPGPAGEVCRQCLAAANPFGTAPGGAFARMPPGLTVALSAVVTAVVLGLLLRQVWRSHARARRHAQRLTVVGRRLGDRLWALPTQAPAAYSLPGGVVVVSDAALARLRPEELAAVLAHERAHLRQRHHALVLVVRTLAQAFGWVPLVARAADVVSAYAEMAADDAAIAATGRLPLARALAKLHGPTPAVAPDVALHAAGDLSRVRRMLDEQERDGGLTGMTVAAVAYVALTSAGGLLVTVPYLRALVAC